jgi:hypothetical protein
VLALAWIAGALPVIAADPGSISAAQSLADTLRSAGLEPAVWALEASAPDPSRPKKKQAIERNLQRAHQAFEELRMAEARKRAERAWRQANAILDEDGAQALAIEAGLLRAVIAQADSRRSDADQALDELHRIAPDAAIDETRIRPDVVHRWIELCKNQEDALATLTLELDADEAQLIVDGRARDASTPIPMSPGSHVVAVRGPKMSALVRKIDLEPKQSARLELEPARMMPASYTRAIQSAMSRDDRAAIGQLLAGDGAAVIADEGRRALVVAPGGSVHTLPVDDDTGAQCIRLLRASKADAVPVEPPLPPMLVERAPNKSSCPPSIAPWILAAASALTAALATDFLVQAGSSASQANDARGARDPGADHLDLAADHYRVLAVTGFSIAAVGAAAAIWLGIRTCSDAPP